MQTLIPAISVSRQVVLQKALDHVFSRFLRVLRCPVVAIAPDSLVWPRMPTPAVLRTRQVSPIQPADSLIALHQSGITGEINCLEVCLDTNTLKRITAEIHSILFRIHSIRANREWVILRVHNEVDRGNGFVQCSQVGAVSFLRDWSAPGLGFPNFNEARRGHRPLSPTAFRVFDDERR